MTLAGRPAPRRVAAVDEVGVARGLTAAGPRPGAGCRAGRAARGLPGRSRRRGRPRGGCRRCRRIWQEKAEGPRPGKAWQRRVEAPLPRGPVPVGAAGPATCPPAAGAPALHDRTWCAIPFLMSANVRDRAIVARAAQQREELISACRARPARLARPGPDQRRHPQGPRRCRCPWARSGRRWMTRTTGRARSRRPRQQAPRAVRSCTGPAR
jgi:hypothetical protein